MRRKDVALIRLISGLREVVGGGEHVVGKIPNGHAIALVWNEEGDHADELLPEVMEAIRNEVEALQLARPVAIYATGSTAELPAWARLYEVAKTGIPYGDLFKFEKDLTTDVKRAKQIA